MLWEAASARCLLCRAVCARLSLPQAWVPLGMCCQGDSVFPVLG